MSRDRAHWYRPAAPGSDGVLP